MDTLLELAAILDRKRLSKIDVFDKTLLNKNSKDLYFKFYEGLASGKFSNDKIACKNLYGIESPDHRYRMLKSRIKKKMYKTILLFDPKDNFHNNKKNLIYNECITALYIIELLIKMRGVNKICIELIKDHYAKAEEFKFYEILKIYSYYLMYHYAFSGNSKKYEEENKKFNLFIEYSSKELLVKQITSHTTLLFNKNQRSNKSILLEINNNLNKLEQIISNFPDPESTYFYYYTLIAYHELSASYNDVYNISKLIDQLFKKYPFIVSDSRKFLNISNRAKVLLHLKKYETGIKLINNVSAILFLEPNSNNWFITKEIEFKLYLHSQRIDNAYKVYNAVTKNVYLKTTYPQSKEKWKIYQAYLVFLDNYLNKGDFKFPIAKFLNEVSFYTKDKSGFNFTIRVIEILYLFAKKQFNIIFAKTDALKLYRTRYLNDDTYIRSRLFLNALLKAEKDGFTSKAMRNGYLEIEELKNGKRQLIIADWEVLPYEMIWDILVDLAKE